MKNNKKKKSRKLCLILIVIVIVVFFLILLVRNTYSVTESKTYTRKELQDMVVATALSYYYNTSYSNYEQYSMDASVNSFGIDGVDKFYSASFSWRNLGSSPEMVNRNNIFTVTSSSYAFLVYIHSLGYDLSEYVHSGEEYEIYRKVLNGSYYQNFNLYDILDSDNTLSTEMLRLKYRKAYYYNGNAFQTKKLTRIVSQVFADETEEVDDYISLSNNTYKKNIKNSDGKYINNIEDRSSVVFHHRGMVNIDIKELVSSVLQPGDIVAYENVSVNGNEETSSSAHTVIYIGDGYGLGQDSSNNSYVFLHVDSNNKTADTNTSDAMFSTFNNVVDNNTGLVISDDRNAISSFTMDTFYSLLEGINRISILRPINYYYYDGVDSDDVENSTETFIIDSNETYIDNDVPEKYSQRDEENAVARNQLNKLRIEQYQYTKERVDVNNYYLGNYNSINNGDKITYSLRLKSMLVQDNYDKLSVIARVPVGTTYDNVCGELYDNSKISCKFKNGVVTFTVESLGPQEEVFLYYMVKVNNTNVFDKIVNDGMEIKKSSMSIYLKLGEMVTYINPTINKKANVDIFEEKINKFKNLSDDKKIIFDTSENQDNNDYKKLDNSDLITSESLKLSELGYVKSIYYSSLGINLDLLNKNVIKNSIFKSNSEYYNVDANDKNILYIKRVDDDINKYEIGSTEYIINKMLVPGMYGGRLLKGNDNKDRARYITATNFEYGDLIVTYKEDDIASFDSIYVWLGFDEDSSGNVKFKMKKFNSDGVKTITSDTEFRKIIYDNGLFVVLRPTRVYGTTINYEYNGGISDVDTYVTYNTYQNLTIPTKEDYVVTYEYNGGQTVELPSKINVKNKFINWYSESDFTRKVENGDILDNNKAHVLYAGWETDEITLPEPKQHGYVFKGWYNGSTLVGYGGDKFTPTEDITLFATWTTATLGYVVSFDSSITVDNNYVKYLPSGMSVSDLLEKITVITANVKILDINREEKINTDKLSTGDVVAVYVDDKLKSEYVISVLGDSNGDGKVSLIDLVQIRKHIVGWVNQGVVEKKTGIYYDSLDMNQDGNVNLIDLVRIRKKIVGMEK